MKALLLALAVMTCGVVARAQVRSEWQSSEYVSVQLTVRDKYGSLRDYEATFIVYTPDGLRLTKTVRVQRDDVGAATFPDDFKTPPKYLAGARGGQYRWECIVEGKAVVKGRFMVTTTHDPPRARPARQGRKARAAPPALLTTAPTLTPAQD